MTLTRSRPDSAVAEIPPPSSAGPGPIAAILAIAFACALTLAMQGYQFGKSNHTVYLLDALRHAHPGVLDHDWFCTQTLQYHAAFGLLTRVLMSIGLLQAGFLIGYLALLVMLHGAWWKITRALGASLSVFLISEVLFHLLAGGTALGMYQFLQDGSFLPSNIASVAMLCGIYLWLSRRRGWSAVAFGIAGLIHLNYAIVAPIVWLAMWLFERSRDRQRLRLNDVLGAVAMIELCLMNLVPALAFMRGHEGPMPMHEFVDLYVRLRHPHHYDPSAWPPALWASFLIPIPFACIEFTRRARLPVSDHGAATRAVMRFMEIFLALLLIALLFAGIWYVSETAVQLSLWRFSVFVKMLSCLGLAMWLERMFRRRRGAAVGAVIVGSAMIIACLVRGPYLGFFHMPEDPPSYLSACDWIRAHTPEDAIFLVPPNEEEFRLRAQRAIVVNYKSVPQLAGELAIWRDRLEDVLNLRDLTKLPTPFTKTLQAIGKRYESLPPDDYEAAAKKYGARYILVDHRLPSDWEGRRIDIGGSRAWFLYDLSR